jgi:hypothetical protein
VAPNELVASAVAPQANGGAACQGTALPSRPTPGRLYQVQTIEQLARSTLARQRFLLLLFGIFAGLALLLACVGIYGALADVTRQRVPEIGVRMARG